MVRRVCETHGRLFGVALLGALLVSSCRRSAPHQRELAPLIASSWLIDLDVPGFGKAALAVPLGAVTPRHLVIALHGSADRPEWACSALRAIAGPEPFVLCPRGVQRRDFPANDVRYTFASADDTARELRAALSELKRRFGAHLAAGAVILSGFEQGADQAAWIAREEPSFFSRLLLIGPAASTWPSSQAALFGRAGGERVLFACPRSSSDECTEKALLTSRAGAEARVVPLDSEPLALDAPTRQKLAQGFRWLAGPAPSNLRKGEHLAGNPLSADGPVVPRIAP